MMGSETRYWCDRCGATVEGLEYVEFSRENAADDRPTRKTFGLCETCCYELMADVDAFMAQAGVA